MFSELSKDAAEQKEIELIKYYNSTNNDYGYNISTGGESHSGCKHSIEARKKLSESSRANNPRYWKDKHLSEDTKKKISDKKKGHKLSIETCRKMSESRRGEKNHNSKKVKCLEIDIIYGSIGEATLNTGIAAQNIWKVCKGQRKTAGGYHWKYVN